MANPQRDKGARYERAALRFWIESAERERIPLVAKPDRSLGEGRREDKGDLIVLPDCAVQVKAHNDTVRALNLAGAGAERQRINRGVPLGLGMVPVVGARSSSVNWLLCSLAWPIHLDVDEYLITGTPARAIAHVRNDQGGIPRSRRIALVRRSGLPDMWVGTFEAWAAAYRDSNQPVLI